MKKEDFMDLLEVLEGIRNIEKAVDILTGRPLEGETVSGVYALWMVLRRNSAKCFQESADIDEDSDNYEKFVAIIEKDELTVEEKYKQLIAE